MWRIFSVWQPLNTLRYWHGSETGNTSGSMASAGNVLRIDSWHLWRNGCGGENGGNGVMAATVCGKSVMCA